MPREDLQAFHKNWERFAVQLKGALLTQSRRNTFSFAAINLILDDCTSFWESKHEEGGRWLDKYEQVDRKGAEKIREILLDDMTFNELSSEKESTLLQYAAPVGGAVTGFLLSRSMGASRIVQMASTVVTGAAAYPLANSYLATRAENKRKELVQRYMQQLAQYKQQIESVLEDE